mgnify:CR=1 FL=1
MNIQPEIDAIYELAIANLHDEDDRILAQEAEPLPTIDSKVELDKQELIKMKSEMDTIYAAAISKMIEEEDEE